MNRKREKPVLCFASSSGGHYNQLLELMPLMMRYDSFIVTEKTNYKDSGIIKKYYLKQINRNEIGFIFIFMLNTLRSFCIFIKERPSVIITTGTLAVIPLCLIIKLFRGKIVYIESFAKTRSATETGKLLYKIADRFYVQWESMLAVYPEAVYLGSIY
jgi:UDP-N-acetylglucosamine:LPS N-acetylglucosamine transferase